MTRHRLICVLWMLLTAPPQPPAQTGTAASDKVGQAPGTVDPAVAEAVKALNRGVPPAALVPKPPPPMP